MYNLPIVNKICAINDDSIASLPGGAKGKRVNTWNASSALRNEALRDAKRLSKPRMG